MKDLERTDDHNGVRGDMDHGADDGTELQDIGCTYYDSEDRSEQRQTVNVLNDYYDAFKEAYNTFEQQKNDLLETKTIHK